MRTEAEREPRWHLLAEPASPGTPAKGGLTEPFVLGISSGASVGATDAAGNLVGYLGSVGR